MIVVVVGERLDDSCTCESCVKRREWDELGYKFSARALLADDRPVIRIPERDEYEGVLLLAKDGELPK